MQPTPSESAAMDMVETTTRALVKAVIDSDTPLDVAMAVTFEVAMGHDSGSLETQRILRVYKENGETPPATVIAALEAYEAAQEGFAKASGVDEDEGDDDAADQCGSDYHNDRRGIER